jgi:drug/metabolite transporter (DMT)-like permease
LKNKLPAFLAVVAANIIYGLNYVIAKGIMPDFLHPRAIIFIRTSVATLVFWVVSIFFKKDKIDKRDLPIIMLSAVFGISLNQIMFFEGLNLTTSINASILMVGIPIGVLVFSRLFGQNTISSAKVTGLLFGTAGAAYLILSKGSLEFSKDTFLGNVLVIINVSSYALFLVLVKPLVSKYHPLTLMKWIFLFGFLFVLPFTLPKAMEADWNLVPLNIWLSISYVVIFATILAYFFNNYSLTKMSAASNSAFIYSQPLIASLFAIFTGRESLKSEQIVAAVFIFVGVYFVIRPQKKLYGS